MKILIGAGITFLYQLNEFSKKLNEYGAECKVVLDRDYVTDFPSKELRGLFRTRKKFDKLISTFEPDVVLIDRMSKFGLEVIKSGIPLFLIARGHYWQQNEWNKKTVYKNWLIQKLVEMRFKVDEQLFESATGIMAICDYLGDVHKKHYPKQNIHSHIEGIDSSKWYVKKGIELKHPCVGLMQRAHWWGKTSEMLILKKVLEKLPDVQFYWAGHGPFEERILTELEKYENFHWLGKLEYPDKVREFLSEIDIYALITGMDLSPLSLKEAQLMKRAVIATNVGGNPDMMKDGVTGFLVEKGNHKQLIEKIKLLLTDKKLSEQMGNEGRKFIEETYSWEVAAKKFIRILNSHVKK